jgi:cytoskeletal protein RodZ
LKYKEKNKNLFYFLYIIMEILGHEVSPIYLVIAVIVILAVGWWIWKERKEEQSKKQLPKKANPEADTRTETESQPSTMTDKESNSQDESMDTQMQMQMRMHEQAMQGVLPEYGRCGAPQ